MSRPLVIPELDALHEKAIVAATAADKMIDKVDVPKPNPKDEALHKLLRNSAALARQRVEEYEAENNVPCMYLTFRGANFTEQDLREMD